jgi:4-azaleucine resistance transporter AzlC
MQDGWRGAGRALGIIAGFLPIAMSFGAIAAQTGLTNLTTMGMSVWIFAGASQFAAVEGVRQNLPWFSIVLTVLIINLRHVPMSFSAAQRYARFGHWQHLLLCHGLLDETFALESAEPPQSFAYYLGMHTACWVAWICGTWLGCQFGTLLPERWLQFALPSLFLYLLMTALKSRWSRKTVGVIAIGIAIVLLTQSLGATGLLLSMVVVAIAASYKHPGFYAGSR